MFNNNKNQHIAFRKIQNNIVLLQLQLIEYGINFYLSKKSLHPLIAPFYTIYQNLKHEIGEMLFRKVLSIIFNSKLMLWEYFTLKKTHTLYKLYCRGRHVSLREQIQIMIIS